MTLRPTQPTLAQAATNALQGMPKIRLERAEVLRASVNQLIRQHPDEPEKIYLKLAQTMASKSSSWEFKSHAYQSALQACADHMGVGGAALSQFACDLIGNPGAGTAADSDAMSVAAFELLKSHPDLAVQSELAGQFQPMQDTWWNRLLSRHPEETQWSYEASRAVLLKQAAQGADLVQSAKALMAAGCVDKQQELDLLRQKIPNLPHQLSTSILGPAAFLRDEPDSFSGIARSIRDPIDADTFCSTQDDLDRKIGLLSDSLKAAGNQHHWFLDQRRSCPGDSEWYFVHQAAIRRIALQSVTDEPQVSPQELCKYVQSISALEKQNAHLGVSSCVLRDAYDALPNASWKAAYELLGDWEVTNLGLDYDFQGPNDSGSLTEDGIAVIGQLARLPDGCDPFVETCKLLVKTRKLDESALLERALNLAPTDEAVDFVESALADLRR